MRLYSINFNGGFTLEVYWKVLFWDQYDENHFCVPNEVSFDASKTINDSISNVGIQKQTCKGKAKLITHNLKQLVGLATSLSSATNESFLNVKLNNLKWGASLSHMSMVIYLINLS